MSRGEILIVLGKSGKGAFSGVGAGCRRHERKMRSAGSITSAERLLLSETGFSDIGARLWADYQYFDGRDLSEYDIA